MSLSKTREALIRRLGTPRTRAREGLFVVEGIRGAREFLRPELPMEIRFALASPRLEKLEGGTRLLELLGSRGISPEEVGEDELARVSDTEASQGILLVVEEPRGLEAPLRELRTPRILLLDGIQDPGNVGTLIRSAGAFGLDGVVALDGTADPWAPKVVRATAGAPARIPVVRTEASRVSAWLASWQIPLLANRAGGRDVRKVAPASGGWALALGNEGSGVREELMDLADEVVSIFMAPGVDSLNVAVAGSILLFSLAGPGPGSPQETGVTRSEGNQIAVDDEVRPNSPGHGGETG